MSEKILVIRHGALGDLILCMQGFQDIRAGFPQAHITLLTAPEFAFFARSMPWFDAVIEDDRASLLQFWKTLGVGTKLRREKFDRVIDLQNKPRTALYRRLFFGKNMKWSGQSTVQEKIHHQDKILRQLRDTGIQDSGPLKIDWLSAPLARFKLPQDYAVLIPGSSPHRLEKRWPAAQYAALARALQAKQLTSVLIGTKSDVEAIAQIKKEAKGALDLCGETNFAELASLFRGARLVVANDTGPAHLAALLGAPTLVLFSKDSEPARSGPRGPRSAYLQKDNLADLPVEAVLEALGKIIFG